jgi:glycosyltransferase involved in cell wall biosynthesis
MISVITPTHNTKFLPQVAESLRKQTYPEPWEWVVVLNNGAEYTNSDSEKALLRQIDPFTIRVVDANQETLSGVGAIKKFAFAQAKGDILVELDHDDLLTPEALAEIAKAFEDPTVGFVYSNFAEYEDITNEAHRYNAAWGWRYRDYELDGTVYAENLGFDPTAHSICSIYFAPNHLRAWRRSVYEQIGGHDASLPVADDHDLVCRTYLVTKMVHLDQCLYLYRLHQDAESGLRNTYREHFDQVQTLAHQVQAKYLDQLVERWADLTSGVMIDLCSGGRAPSGYLSIDLRKGFLKADLEEDFPFPDNSVAVVRAFDALEHLKNPIHTMNEIYRVLQPGGWLLSHTPSTTGPNGEAGSGAFQDPTHISFWNANSFWYWTQRELAQYIEGTGRFQAVRVETHYPTPQHQNSHIPYVRADLVAVKGDYRVPGLVQI